MLMLINDVMIINQPLEKVWLIISYYVLYFNK